MSGSGPLIVPLLEAGFSVDAVDESEGLLASWSERCKLARFDIPLLRQKVATLNLPFRYAAAIVAGGSLQLLAPDAPCKALACLRAHLVEPAVLLLDLYVPEAAVHTPGAPVVEVKNAPLADGSIIVRRSETVTDPKRRQLLTTSRYEHRVGGRIVARQDESKALTWYSEEEIETMLRHAGYGDIRIETTDWRDFAGQRYAVSARVEAHS